MNYKIILKKSDIGEYLKRDISVDAMIINDLKMLYF